MRGTGLVRRVSPDPPSAVVIDDGTGTEIDVTITPVTTPDYWVLKLYRTSPTYEVREVQRVVGGQTTPLFNTTILDAEKYQVSVKAYSTGEVSRAVLSNELEFER
jgi:hypothetical protein